MPYPIPNYESEVAPQLQTGGAQCGHNQYWSPMLGAPLGVVGGAAAREYEFPSQVTIRGNSFGCGGSIIDANWVLTAAHCCPSTNVSEYKINYKIQLMQTLFDQTTNERGAALVIPHPAYYEPYLRSDFCLIKVDSPFDFSNPNEAQPACLPTNCTMEKCDFGDDVLVAGLGRTANDGALGHTLLKAYINIMTHAVCTNTYGSYWQPEVNKQFCAWIENQGMAAICSGDSGGPLFCYKHGYFMLQGVTSFSSGNCEGIIDPKSSLLYLKFK